MVFSFGSTSGNDEVNYWRRQYEDQTDALERLYKDKERERDARMQELREQLREGETTASSWDEALNKLISRAMGEAVYEDSEDVAGTYFADLIPVARKALELWKANKSRIEARLHEVMKEELGEIADQLESEFGGDRGYVIQSLRENDYEPLVNW